MKIGFIGLGIMGAPMAQNLMQAGHEMIVRTRSKVPDALKGATVCKTNAEVARAAEVVILMLPDTPDVEQVLLGEEGVAAGLSKGKLVIDMSSISPIDTKRFAAKINELGCDYLDAPVSGGEVGAKAASLTIMVGGPEPAFERAKPLFEKMGKNITLVGGNGDGQTTKVANQIIVALNIAAVGEALLFASKAGADPAKVRQALAQADIGGRHRNAHGGCRRLAQPARGQQHGRQSQHHRQAQHHQGAPALHTAPSANMLDQAWSSVAGFRFGTVPA
jgi:2-hydroxy-3-oxopropionate reductase